MNRQHSLALYALVFFLLLAVASYSLLHSWPVNSPAVANSTLDAQFSLENIFGQ